MSDQTNEDAFRKVAPGDLHREINRDPVAHALWVCFQQGELPSYEAFLTHLAVVLLRAKRKMEHDMVMLHLRFPITIGIDPNKEGK